MKSWQDLKLTDDYLFSQIMREEDFCKLFLEMLMGIKVEKVVYLEAQSTFFRRQKVSAWTSISKTTGKSITSKCRR